MLKLVVPTNVNPLITGAAPGSKRVYTITQLVCTRPLARVTDFLLHYSQLPFYRSRRDQYYSFNITEFRYKGSNITVLRVLGEIFTSI